MQLRRDFLSSSGGALDPPHRFVGEFIESDYGQGEIFFFRVLDFAVADAVEAPKEVTRDEFAGAGFRR